jgi:hypothetical protein
MQCDYMMVVWKTKVCSRCKQELSINNFNKDKKSKDKIARICKKCINEYNHRICDERKAYCLSFKKNKGCLICKEECIHTLHFHHLKDKKFKISKYWTKVKGQNISEKDLREELKKCVLICANCHAKLHKGLLKIDGSLYVE